MRNFTQRELLDEGLLDVVRGVASATKKAAEVFVPELTDSAGRIAKRFTDVGDSYLKNQPVSVLKRYLKTVTWLELLKIDTKGIKKKQANPQKSYFKRINGPKNVTQIPFTAAIYKKGTERNYSTYGSKPHKALPGKGEENKESANLVAEIFRTSEGLAIGDIYDQETGEVIVAHNDVSGSTTTQKFQDIVDRLVKRNKITINRTGGGDFLVSMDHAEDIIASAYASSNMPLDLNSFAGILTPSKGKTDVTGSEIKNELKKRGIVKEQTQHQSQKVLLEQLKTLF